ncbi:MAG: VWA domain-containing protein, partial [Vicinamibacterales bacterium]
MRVLLSVVVGCVALQVGTTRPAAIAASPDTQSLIRVMAVVTDRLGRPLTGLKPADFDVLVDGQPQALDSVELAGAGPATPRTLAFLLDEFHVAAEHSAVVRDSLLRFVDQSLRPGDLAVVVKPLDSLTTITPTADRDEVRSAISTFEGRKGDYTPRTVFERNYMAQAPNAIEWARAQIVTSALRALGMSLSDKSHSRPAIVLVSDGFARMRSSREVPANLQTAIRILNRANAPVYAYAPALTAQSDDATQAVDPAFAALTALTTQTGGDLVVGTSALETGLARMARDLDAHYVLTYHAAHGSDGRFHALQVGIKRQGAQVRARTGYVAPISEAMRAAARPAPSAPLRMLRRSTLIQSWS